MNKALIGLLFTLCSCNNNTYHHSFRPTPNIGWKKSDTLFYNIQQPLDTGQYTMEIGIRHLTSYPYRDIWLEISYQPNDTSYTTKDTLHLFLANEKGDWKGEGIGGLLQHTHEQTVDLNITKEKPYQIYITHLMEDTLLKSIHDVGIRLTKEP